METILTGIPGVQVHLNDVLVTESKLDGGTNLKAVLQRFRENSVKLRKSKCTFRRTEVSYLGHRISSEGLQPLEKKMEAVMKAPSPKNVSEFRSYIGLLTYYNKFLPNMASLLAPLYDLLRPLNGMVILVMVDSHTKWLEAVTMPHATADATITALCEIFSRLG
ncbi:uncharacterized protein LOC144180086 [Haemaphysalis longicornis]